MASLSELPADLVDEAKNMPDGLLDRLDQGEAEARLRHVVTMNETAANLPAEQYRHVTAHARKYRDAIPWAEYKPQMDKLMSLAHKAPAGELTQIYLASMSSLEQNEPQTPGIQQAITAHSARQMRAERDGTAAKAVKGKVSKAIENEIAKAMAPVKQRQDELRREIAELRARQREDASRAGR